MNRTLDAAALRHWVTTVTMIDANMGTDDPTMTVMDNWRDSTVDLAAMDGADLDDTLRLVAAARPFGADTPFTYLWAGEANDERYDRIILLTPLADGVGQRAVEVSLLTFGQFPGGDVVAAVEFVTATIAKALRAD